MKALELLKAIAGLAVMAVVVVGPWAVTASMFVSMHDPTTGQFVFGMVLAAIISICLPLVFVLFYVVGAVTIVLWVLTHAWLLLG